MKILLGMSGGVDSAAAAIFLQEDGHTVTGVTLRMQKKINAVAEQQAAQCAETLGIPHVVLPCQAQFEQQVLRFFADAYLSGETPNPCVRCNRFLKLAVLLDYAKQNGFDAVATGHYARIERDPETGEAQLLRGISAEKDQSYFLSMLTGEQLQRLLFPLGTHTKQEARDRAFAAGFSCASAPDSQDICFVPEGDYAACVAEISGVQPEPGCFLDASGAVLGTHRGQIHYTVGQRKGLGISLGKPAYVIAKSAKHNTVTLGDSSELFSDSLTAREFVWQCPAPQMPIPVLAQIRSRHQAQPALAFPQPNHRVALRFEAPQRAIAPGQIVALYQGDRVLGGGIICEEDMIS